MDSSLRPRSRPIKDQTEEMLRPKSRLDAQREKEKRQLQMKTFGDLEYRADLDKQLSWNPIARLGYNPDAHKVFKQRKPKTGLAFQGGGPRTIKKLKELGYEGAEKAQQGSVITTTNYSFSPVISHEFTHIGFDILKKRRNKDPEAFDKKYGEDAGRILKLTESGKLKEEYYIEFFDDLNTRFNTDMLPKDFKEFPKSTIRDTVQSYPSGPAVSIADRGEEKRNKRVAEIKKFQNVDLKRKEKGKESLYLDRIDKGILGLMDAAQDILTEQGEPPKAKMKTLSFWEKVGKSFSNLKPVGTRGLYEGGLSAQTEGAFNIDAEGRRRRQDRPEPEQKPVHPLETVPFFQRPKGSSTDDIQVGEDDVGNPVFQGRLGTYIVRLNPDQRTTRQKITEAIPTIKESVSEYLKDPKLPTREQMGQFARDATIGAIEDLGETMFTPKGTLGDVFSLASGAGAASVPFDVPKGALRIFGGVGAEGTAKDKNLKKAIKLLKKSNVDPTNVQDSYFTNKKIWEQTGWYVDPKDGQWRFEIDDSKSTLKDFKSVFKTNKNPTDPADDPNLSSSFFKELGKVPLKREDGKYKKLNEVLEHEEFFRKYPDLKDVDVIFYSDPSQPKLLGSAGDDTISVNLSAFKNYEDIKSTLIHEIQHIVQYEEGFVRGASAKFIPNVLTEKKSKEIQTKIAPLKKEEEKLSRELNAADNQRKIMREQFANNPLKNLSESDQIAIYKLKPYNEEKMDYEGPSWASIARDYDVPVVEVREAYGRYRLLRHLDKEVNKYNLALNKILSDLYELEQENFDIERNFYRGAGGEIEARLAQYRRNLSAKEREKSFPIDSRTTMLQKEGDKFEYTGKEGVDPYQYKVQPRREPEKEKGFLSGIKKKLGLSESRENPDIEPEVEDAFTKLADIQRGKPELAMVEAQKIYGGGVMPYALEHAGDLTHRMAERGGRFGAEFVAPKVTRLLDSLLSDYGFEKEMLENIQSNARFHYKGDNPNISFEEYKKEYENNIDKALNKYSEAHKKVPVYNRMQLAGREAAIAIGEKRYTDAIEQLYIIDQAIKNNTYKQEALKFNPNIDFRKKNNFAEGGAVDMSLDRQMSFAFKEGGLRDDGMNQDPVSGNEVPSGSMAKEVRDDIPAQLSEGEYVVPADVVRYYGVKFFEDLRIEAKMGLQSMEANGRIGGEPVPVGGPKAGENPLTPEEMEMLKQLGMSAGGSVRGFSRGGSVPDWVTPPPEGAMVTQVLTTLVNPITGETFTAPTGGYSINYNALQQAESPPKMADFDYFKSAPFQNSYERRPPGSTYFRTQAEIDADKGITPIIPGEDPIEPVPQPVEDEYSGLSGPTTMYHPNGSVETVNLPDQRERFNKLASEGYSNNPQVLNYDRDSGRSSAPSVSSTAWADKFDYSNPESIAKTNSDELKKPTPFGGAIGGVVKAGKAAQSAANYILAKARGANDDTLGAMKNEYETFVGSSRILGLLPDGLTNGDRLAKEVAIKRNIGLSRDAKDINGNPIFSSDVEYAQFNESREKAAQQRKNPEVSKVRQRLIDKYGEQEVKEDAVSKFFGPRKGSKKMVDVVLENEANMRGVSVAEYEKMSDYERSEALQHRSQGRGAELTDAIQGAGLSPKQFRQMSQADKNEIMKANPRLREAFSRHPDSRGHIFT